MYNQCQLHKLSPWEFPIQPHHSTREKNVIFSNDYSGAVFSYFWNKREGNNGELTLKNSSREIYVYSFPKDNDNSLLL